MVVQVKGLGKSGMVDVDQTVVEERGVDRGGVWGMS